VILHNSQSQSITHTATPKFARHFDVTKQNQLGIWWIAHCLMWHSHMYWHGIKIQNAVHCNLLLLSIF